MFQSRKQDYFNWKDPEVSEICDDLPSFSPASRIILIESSLINFSCSNVICFSPASRIILIESSLIKFSCSNVICFSPASRIILIESNNQTNNNLNATMFQSRKQDYFNWKAWDMKVIM